MPHARPHAHTHAQTRTRERRQQLATEAARLMAQGGIRDFHQAKRKAAETLGITDDASLPRNREIEDALREYQRLFQGETHGLELRRRREAALGALEFFATFEPRLVGPVLEGSADAHSQVQLHLHADDAEAVPRFLDEHGIPADARTQRIRLDRERSEEVPVHVFVAEEIAFDLSVLPRSVLRQAPLSGIHERPMKRASLAQLRALLAQDEIAGFEAGG
ncbi:MAG TPA: hypothetical protein VNI56_02160 [Xanthomonadaceae bacterium]|nr:hypothetical protein [Xanthomonadaceae bacterium]